MTGDPTYTNTNAFDTSWNTTYIDALKIAGCVMAGLILLVLLRFFVSIIIDVIILGDYNSAKRSMGSCIRRLCPCWHRRTQPAEDNNNSNDNDDLQLQQRQQQETMNEINGRIFGNRSIEERKQIISSLLPGKYLSQKDMEALKDDEEAAECNKDMVDEECPVQGVRVCSICLVEFEIDDHVVSAEECLHIYHHDCIITYHAHSHGTNCPYCRRQMIPVESLEAAATYTV